MFSNINCSCFFVFHILLFYVCFSTCFNSVNSERTQSMVGIGLVLDLNSSFGAMLDLFIDMAITDFYRAHPNYRTRFQLYKKDARRVLDVYLAERTQSMVGIGVVLDRNSSFGAMLDLCIDLAIHDFYRAHPNYRTRLQLYKKDAGRVLDVYLAVLDLAKNEEVIGVLGPQTSIDESFVAAVGKTVQVPIISFTAGSSALSYTDNPYFLTTSLDNAVQAQALAAVCQRFEWHKVVILYEDTQFDSQFLSHLIKQFQDRDIELANITSIPTSAKDSHILKKLNKLKTRETRVFLVHMNPDLGSRLFAIAHKAGMMSKGYAWVITHSLSIFMDSINSDAHDSMDGVLGIRPYVSSTKNLTSFKERWKKNMLSNISRPITELNIYGLWAYDAVTALAISIENMSPVDKNGTENIGLRISALGPTLLNELSRTKFRGLTGNFQLVKGKLKSSALEIFNVIGTGEKRVGFWTPRRGLVRELSPSSVEPTHMTLNKQLKKITWPGDSLIQPKDWAIQATGKLRVGVPCTTAYKEFVQVVKFDPKTKYTNATGFSVDIFLAAWEWLRLDADYEFHCYKCDDISNSNWSYDSMLQMIPKEYDMVVADTTLWAPRTSWVDFSLPYSESGVVLVVKNKKPLDMWIFVRPLRWDLWLAVFVACILMGIALRILERRAIRAGKESVTPRAERSRNIYWSPIAILAFPERNLVSNSWSVFVLVCWLFMAFILMQSFTANLSAILTVDQLNFAFSGDYHVGYQAASFMKDFLIGQLGIPETRLRAYDSVEGFHEAMSNGSIDAIFDEIPYMKLFLKRYEPQYKMVGPTYRTNGLGFAFEMNSPLVAQFSRAILNVTQGKNMQTIEQKNLGPGYSSQDPLSSVVSQGRSSLTLREFTGLFILIGSLTLFALFCSETEIGPKLTDIKRRFIIPSCFGCRSRQVHSTKGANDGEHTTHADCPPPPGDGGDIELICQDDEEINETRTRFEEFLEGRLHQVSV